MINHKYSLSSLTLTTDSEMYFKITLCEDFWANMVKPLLKTKVIPLSPHGLSHVYSPLPVLELNKYCHSSARTATKCIVLWLSLLSGAHLIMRFIVSSSQTVKCSLWERDLLSVTHIPPSPTHHLVLLPFFSLACWWHLWLFFPKK